MRVIAIDGPSGSGKSSVSRRLADELGLDHLDTGAMYRAVTFAVLERSIDPESPADVAEVARDVELVFADDGRVVVDGSDATSAIRGPAVTSAVSHVAANPEVRAVLVERQRRWATEHGGGVVEGRDIGSVVFPDATLKVYLTADEAIRTRRRAAEADPGDAERLAAEVVRRDRLDSTRAVSPLTRTDDAIEIDTTSVGIDEVLALIRKELT